jgi:hypothetical protein
LEEAIKFKSLSGLCSGRSTGTGNLGEPFYENKLPSIFSETDSKKYCCISMTITVDTMEFEKFELYLEPSGDWIVH